MYLDIEGISLPLLTNNLLSIKIIGSNGFSVVERVYHIIFQGYSLGFHSVTISIDRFDVINVVPEAGSIYHVRAVKIGNAILKASYIMLLCFAMLLCHVRVL